MVSCRNPRAVVPSTRRTSASRSTKFRPLSRCSKDGVLHATVTALPKSSPISQFATGRGVASGREPNPINVCARDVCWRIEPRSVDRDSVSRNGVSALCARPNVADIATIRVVAISARDGIRRLRSRDSGGVVPTTKGADLGGCDSPFPSSSATTRCKRAFIALTRNGRASLSKRVTR